MNITVLVKPVPYKSIVDNDGNVVRNKIKRTANAVQYYLFFFFKSFQL